MGVFPKAMGCWRLQQDISANIQLLGHPVATQRQTVPTPQARAILKPRQFLPACEPPARRGKSFQAPF